MRRGPKLKDICKNGHNLSITRIILKNGHGTICRECNREYYIKNKEKYKAYLVKWKQENTEKVKEYRKRSNSRGKQTLALWQSAKKTAWMKVIELRGMKECSRCGYDKCFDAIEFHHVNPKNKEREIGGFLNLKITPERIEELDKCIALCRNCHSELHFEQRQASQYNGSNQERKGS